MANPITREDVAHVALLARLKVTDDELALYTEQLGAVLDHARDVASLDIADVPPTSHPLPLVNVFRSDEIRPCVDREEVLACAPDTQDNRFRVPRILNEQA